VTRTSPETLLGTTTSEPNYIDPRSTEYDPAGGNSGLVSSFQLQYLPSEPPLGLENDSNYINGQVVNATHDGIRIPISALKNLIRHGNSIGISTQDRRLLSFLGIRVIPGSNNAPTPEDGSDSFTYGTRDEYVLESGVLGFSFGYSKHYPRTMTFNGPNPCNRMAARAQSIADSLIREAGSDLVFGSKSKRESAWDNVLKQFDGEFTPMYIGRTVDGLRAAYILKKTMGGIKTPPMDQYGQQDFKGEYLDSQFDRYSDDILADQVHHFAAFQSMAINNVPLPAAIHQVGDFMDYNLGDVALSDAAYKMGMSLREDPRRLRNIGDTIRNSLCVRPEPPGKAKGRAN
jgi:hypothetical protein